MLESSTVLKFASDTFCQGGVVVVVVVVVIAKLVFFFVVLSTSLHEVAFLGLKFGILANPLPNNNPRTKSQCHS
jgi:hypothetical protein